MDATKTRGGGGKASASRNFLRSLNSLNCHRLKVIKNKLVKWSIELL